MASVRKNLIYGSLNLMLLVLTAAPSIVYAASNGDNDEVAMRGVDGFCVQEFKKRYLSGDRSFLWTGTIDGVLAEVNATSQVEQANGSLLFVRYDKCMETCGESPEYYTWSDSFQTLSTWILPLIGLILQLPFGGDTLWEAIQLVVRCVGNSISSLTSELWNLRVSS